MSDDSDTGSGERGLSSLWRDERGSVSSARVLLWLVVLTTLGLIVAASCGAVAVPSAGWAILTTMILGFTSWAGGSRLAQYLAPTMSSVVETIAKARPFGVRTTDLDDGKP